MQAGLNAGVSAPVTVAPSQGSISGILSARGLFERNFRKNGQKVKNSGGCLDSFSSDVCSSFLYSHMPISYLYYIHFSKFLSSTLAASKPIHSCIVVAQF